MTFDQFYAAIKQEKFFKPPESDHQMDNWVIFRWETPTGFFATISDGGYCRSVGYQRGDAVMWRVHDAYPTPLQFIGITAEEFNNIKLG